MAPDTDAVVKTPEAAEILGVDRRTLIDLVNSGAIPCWKTPGKHRRFSRAALIAWKNAQAERVEAAG